MSPVALGFSHEATRVTWEFIYAWFRPVVDSSFELLSFGVIAYFCCLMLQIREIAFGSATLSYGHALGFSYVVMEAIHSIAIIWSDINVKTLGISTSQR